MKHEFISIASIHRFLSDEAGAVTVDFVVLTGAIVGLGLAVTGSVASGGLSLAGLTADAVLAVEVGSSTGSSLPTETASNETPSSPQPHHHHDDD